MAYIDRIVDAELDELLGQLPAVAVEGAKAVGKTESAQRRARTRYRLDDPAQRAVVEADPRSVTQGAPPLLVDEWQRVPATWDVVRRAVDDGCPAGQFLLTGSATPAVAPTHSGAGRIVSVRMRPLALAERLQAPSPVSLRTLLDGTREAVSGTTPLVLADYVEEILGSGLPAVRMASGRARRALLDGYIDRIIDVDVAEQGLAVRRPATLRRWLTAYAAATATTASYETIRDAATGDQQDKPARSSTQPWRDTLERLWILDPVPAWLPSRNDLNRLAQAPKHHLVDPALAARLSGLGADALLGGGAQTPPVPRTGHMLGRLFESLVTLGVRVYAQAAEARVFHLRQHGGQREIDLIIERDDRRVLAIEVKLGSTVTDADVRHLQWLRGQLGDDLVDALVINTGPAAYRRPDGVAVVPAALLGA